MCSLRAQIPPQSLSEAAAVISSESLLSSAPLGTPPVTAILFPGQGAQVVGMAGEWCDSHPLAAKLFARAHAIVGYDLLDICRHGPASTLNTTAVSQPAILVTSLAALEVLRSRSDQAAGAGVLAKATITAGLSLGEYTSLVFANAIDFDDAVRLVDARGRAMQAWASIAVVSRPFARSLVKPMCSRLPTSFARETSLFLGPRRPANGWIWQP